MTRDELVNKAYEVFKQHHKVYTDDVELWQTLARATDLELLDFIAEHEGEVIK